MKTVKIGDRLVGDGQPAYVIAEVGSNFDGSLDQAKKLVDLAVEVGADAAKFQSFLPEKIVARRGFDQKSAFQAKWDKSVYQVYSEAVFPREWHRELADYCTAKGIHFLSSPYDKEAVDLLEEIGVFAYKIGSGDITFLDIVAYVAGKGKPIILGVGASTLAEVAEAVDVIHNAGNDQLILLQCVTNYPSPFEDANIRAMVTLGHTFDLPVGYSDHTPGSVVPLGSVALGGCVIEKHFTFDKSRPGPDHPFAMDVDDMRGMIADIRSLEAALGSPVKKLVASESETVILQRRSLWTTKMIPAGAVIEPDMIELLRPATGIPPKYLDKVVGRRARADIAEGVALTWEMV